MPSAEKQKTVVFDSLENEKYRDNIRDTSGKELEREVMPLTLNSKCLAHLSSNHDKVLTMKLFKVACMSY
jgi:hypothetical protein